MVDLAGSEREVMTKAQPTGGRGSHERGGSGGERALSRRLRETAQIKKALSNLGIIIKGLSRGDTPVGLPFRDSILTWLLKVRSLHAVPVQEKQGKSHVQSAGCAHKMMYRWGEIFLFALSSQMSCSVPVMFWIFLFRRSATLKGVV